MATAFEAWMRELRHATADAGVLELVGRGVERFTARTTR